MDAQGALFYSNGVINIVTDLAILPFPALLVWDLQMKLKNKLAVVILFWLRIMYNATYQPAVILTQADN